jgi:hypothetical protein
VPRRGVPVLAKYNGVIKTDEPRRSHDVKVRIEERVPREVGKLNRFAPCGVPRRNEERGSVRPSRRCLLACDRVAKTLICDVAG